MGFFTILRSIEDLLYEVMTWLVFYPRTLWKVIRHPLQMIDYSDLEQSDTPADQYTDTLSPPLFLLLSILLAHGLEIAFHASLNTPKAGIGKLLLNSEENLIILRAILFSIYPLVFAVGLLKRKDVPLDRITLRAPFFSQCYVAALFALLASAAELMTRANGPGVSTIGTIAALGAVIWFVWVQTFWFAQHLGISKIRAAGAALLSFIKASIVNALIAAIFLV